MPDGGSYHRPKKPTGLTIRTYVVQDARGKVVGVKLNRTSAAALHANHPGGTVETHHADKAVPDRKPK